MKKNYQKPAMIAEVILHEGFICQSVTGVSGNTDLHHEGGGTVEPRARFFGDLEMEEPETKKPDDDLEEYKEWED